MWTKLIWLFPNRGEKNKHILNPMHFEIALFGLYANIVEYLLFQQHLTDSFIYSHY